MENNFNRFDEIQDPNLKTYNRCALLSNLLEDFGRDAAANYAESFNDLERFQMYTMMTFIEKLGKDRVHSSITGGMSFTDDIT